jgi:hypothetical protein
MLGFAIGVVLGAMLVWALRHRIWGKVQDRIYNMGFDAGWDANEAVHQRHAR